MARSSQSEHVRFRYGICLNETCDKCKSKEVQEVSVRKDLVCDVCGKPLMECPPPKPKSKLPFVLAGVAALLIGAAVVFWPKGDSDTPKEPEGEPGVENPMPKPVDPDPVKVDPDTLKPADPKPEPKPVNPNYGTVDLGYGVYTGDLKNGKPHGHGTIVYKKSQKIVSSQDFVANPGDEYEGEFRNGRISGNMGYWRHDGNETAVKP